MMPSITGISIEGITIEKYLRLNSNAPPNFAMKNANPTPITPTISMKTCADRI